MTIAKGDREFTTEIYDNNLELVKQITVYINPDRIVAECHPHYESENGWVIPIPRGIEGQIILDTLNSIKEELEDYVNGYGEYADGYENSLSIDEKEQYLLEFFESISEELENELNY